MADMTERDPYTIAERRWSTSNAVVTARVTANGRRTVSIIPTQPGRNAISLDSATAVTDFPVTVRGHLDEIAPDTTESVLAWIEDERLR